jgi:hypothetical protein
LKVRDFERLLASNGVAPSKMDAITRLLREHARVPTSNRGPQAPNITPDTAAVILIAVAGTGKSLNAVRRLEKLEKLKCVEHPNSEPVDELAKMIARPGKLVDLKEIRVGRNARRITFLFDNGVERVYLPKTKTKPDYSGRFIVEGTLSRKLLSDISQMVQDKAAYPKIFREEEPDDDA